MNFDDCTALQDDTRRKAEFNEIAKNLAYWNRNSGKLHRRFDFVAELRKALESAYQAGIANGTPSSSLPPASAPDAPIPWVLIPERARLPFDFICRYGWVVLFYRNAAAWKADPNQWACFRDRGESVQGNARLEFECVYSPRTLSPLIKLGLLKEVDLGSGHRALEITALGLATFEAAAAEGKILSIEPDSIAT